MLLKDKCHEKAMATVKNHKADAINRFSAKREKKSNQKFAVS